MNKFIKYNRNNEPLVTSKITFDIFLKQENPAELIALYHFYYYTSKWQQTTTVKATTNYISSGLHWTTKKVIRIKKKLVELGFIEDVQKRDEATGRIVSHYIKINFLWGEVHPVDLPQGGLDHRVDFDQTNALLTGNLNNIGINTNIDNKGNFINKISNNKNISVGTSPTGRDRSNETFKPLAILLGEIVSSKKNVNITGQKINSWANSIRLMNSADGISYERIEKALKWYEQHHSDEYVPVIESGSTLREKFIRLEAAIERGSSTRRNSRSSGFVGKETLNYKKSIKA